MTTLWVIAGGLGISGIALFLALWQLVKKAKRVEGLEHDIAALKVALEQQKNTTAIFTKPRGSKRDVVDRL